MAQNGRGAPGTGPRSRSARHPPGGSVLWAQAAYRGSSRHAVEDDDAPIRQAELALAATTGDPGLQMPCISHTGKVSQGELAPAGSRVVVLHGVALTTSIRALGA